MNSNSDLNDIDGSIDAKESKLTKNNVKFENNSATGLDNKGFEDEDKNDPFNYRSKFSQSKNKNKIIVSRKIRVGYSEKLKKILFSIFCANFLCYGLANSLIGATIPELKDSLGVDDSKVLSSFTVRYTAYFFSNILTIYTFRYAIQYQYSLGILFYLIGFGFLPLVKNFALFLVLLVLQGAGNVLIDCVPILLTVEMFQEKSKFYSQMLFLFFALGRFLGPLIAGQFVGGRTNEFERGVILNSATSNVTIITGEEETSRFYIPYYLISALFVVVFLAQFGMQCFFPYEKPRIIDRSKRASMRVEPYFPVEELPLTTEEDCENVIKEEARLPNYYKNAVILLFCIILLCYNSIDLIYSLFFATYLNRRKDLELPVELQSSYYCYLGFTNTIGKLCSLVLIWYVPQKIYLFVNWTLILIGIILSNFVTVDKIYILKISLLLVGGGLSSSYPLVFTLANKRVLITSKTQTIFLVAIVSQMLYLPIVFGNFIDDYPKIFDVFLNCFALMAFLSMIVFHFIDLKRTSYLQRSTAAKSDAQI